MGRGHKRSRTQRKHFKESRENIWKYKIDEKNGAEVGLVSYQNSNPSWEPFTTENPTFEEYYKEQGIVSEEEWNEFIHLLRKPLPAAFRINSSGQFSDDILSQLENDFVKTLKADFGNENETEPIRPLPWYPGNLAWHLNFSRMQLRKNQTLERFHEFLKLENEIGNITRQEAVSMVPPLFLGVLPNHYVLDMCAAPGSKTFQLLEMMHQSAKPGSLPDGLVVANDVDVQRCNLLIHQTKRMCSANLIVTHHEAQYFPRCCLTSSHTKLHNMEHDGGIACSTSSRELEEACNWQLLFDRVLCDVPCSGDGTLRKAPDIWRKWNSGMGNGLHHLQVQIAMRGLALLKVGGRMVYSTCSMNPVENEAVVAEVLRRCGSSIELLDVSGELPQLLRRPGLRYWKVRDRGVWLDSYENVPPARRGGIVSSMFPPGPITEVKKVLPDTLLGAEVQDDNVDQRTGPVECHSGDKIISTTHGVIGESSAATTYNSRADSVAEYLDCTSFSSNYNYEGKASFPLERCMRIVPHDQNSGAFFIAVIKKITHFHDNSGINSVHQRGSITEVLKDESNIVKDELRAYRGSSEHISDGNFYIPMEESSRNLQGKQLCYVPTENDMKVDYSDVKEYINNIDKANPCYVNHGSHETAKAAKGQLQIQGKWKGVDPILFFTEDMVIKSIRMFYGIDEAFPLEGHLVTRTNDSSHVKRIYYISQSIHDLLDLNFKVGQPLKIASLGLKIFERQSLKDAYASSPCTFRISSEGLPLLLPYISKQLLCASLTDFLNLLRYRSVKFLEFGDANFGQKASNLLLGCCIVVLNKGDHPVNDIVVDATTIAVGCWKGKTNLSVMVSQMDCLELLERLSVRFGISKGTSSEELKNNSSYAENDITQVARDAEYNENLAAAMGSNEAERSGGLESPNVR